jgi:hypothetical protein
VTIPGYKIPPFLPQTEDIQDCFNSILKGEQAGCRSIEFSIQHPYTVTHRELLARSADGFRNKEPRKGPFGYDVYDIGPENARREVYTKEQDGASFLFDCMISYSDEGRRFGTCDDRFPLKDGNSVHFFFGLGQIGYIPEIESGIRDLMEKFRIKDIEK